MDVAPFQFPAFMEGYLMNNATLPREFVDYRAQLEDGLALILPHTFRLGLDMSLRAQGGSTVCVSYLDKEEMFTVTICDSEQAHAPYVAKIALCLRGRGMKSRRGLTDASGSWKAFVPRQFLHRRVTLDFGRVRPHHPDTD